MPAMSSVILMAAAYFALSELVSEQGDFAPAKNWQRGLLPQEKAPPCNVVDRGERRFSRALPALQDREHRFRGRAPGDPHPASHISGDARRQAHRQWRRYPSCWPGRCRVSRASPAMWKKMDNLHGRCGPTNIGRECGPTDFAQY